MDQLASLAQHKTHRDGQERAALNRFGRIVHHLYHAINCQESTDDCDEQYQCRLVHVLLAHLDTCTDASACDNPICRTWKCVKAHMDVCDLTPCDLCAFKYSDNPLETDDTYEDDEEVQEEEEEVEEDHSNLCCNIS